MAVNPALEGHTLAPTPVYVVGREKIREFARAVFADHPLHHDPVAARAAGYDDVIAPPTFAVVLQQQALDALLAEPDTGIDFSRVVHGEQRFVAERPIVAGDELTAQLTVSSMKTLAGNTMLTSSTAVVDAAGALVVTAISTLVMRGDAA